MLPKTTLDQEDVKEAEMIRKGYNHIKEKVKNTRQESSQLLALAKGSAFFSYKPSLKLSLLGG